MLDLFESLLLRGSQGFSMNEERGVAQVGLFFVFSEHVDRDGFSKIKQEHFDYLSELQHQNCLLASGPFTDMSAAVFLLKADSLEQATDLAARDPIHIHNVRKFWIKEWKVVRLWTFTSHDLP